MIGTEQNLRSFSLNESHVGILGICHLILVERMMLDSTANPVAR